MKILFSTLMSVKKEAKRIRKLLKMIDVTASNQEVQDLVAKYYGWTHFNEMSLHHNNTQRIKATVKRMIFNDPGQMGHGEYSHISGLNGFQRNALEARKKALFKDFLWEVHCEIASDRLIFELFDEPRLNKGPSHVFSLYQMSFSEVTNHFIYYGQNRDKKISFYDQVAIPHSLEKGGVFFISRSTFDSIYYSFRSQLRFKKRPINIINLCENRIESENIRSVQFNEIENTSLNQAILGYLNSCEIPLNNDQGVSELDHRRAFNKIVSPLIAYISLFSKEDRKWIFDLYENSDIDVFLKEIQKRIDTDNSGSFYSANLQKTLDSNLSIEYKICYAMDSCIHARKVLSKMQQDEDGISFDFKDSIFDNEVTFVVFEDDPSGNDAAISMMLGLYRSAVVPMLGSRISNKGKQPLLTRAPLGDEKYAIPVVFESSQRYLTAGISTISWQARAVGIASFFGIDNIDQIKREDETEYHSLVINALNTIFLETASLNALDIYKSDKGISKNEFQKVTDEGSVILGYLQENIPEGRGRIYYPINL